MDWETIYYQEKSNIFQSPKFQNSKYFVIELRSIKPPAAGKGVAPPDTRASYLKYKYKYKYKYKDKDRSSGLLQLMDLVGESLL